MDRSWSTEEERQLTRWWSILKPAQIAKRLGRSSGAIHDKAKKLGLPPNANTRRIWTPDEVELLRTKWGKVDLSSIANNLGRTPVAVQEKAKRLKIGSPIAAHGKTVFQIHRDTAWSRSKIRAALHALALERKHVRLRSAANQRKREVKIVKHQDIKRATQLMEATPKIFRNAKGAGRSTRGKWGVGKKPDCCRGCSTAERPHFAKGLCRRCYDQGRREGRARPTA